MPFFHSLGNGGYDREGDRDGSPCREKCTAAVRSGSLLDHVRLCASCFGFFLEGRLETVLQSSFSARGHAVEAIYATGGIYGEVLAVDRLRLTSMLAITTMRTSFFVKGDPEKRIPGDQAQQRSYRAKRIAEQPSPEYDHEDEYEQRDQSGYHAEYRHVANRDVIKRIVIHPCQSVGQQVIDPHDDRTEQVARYTAEVAVRI